MTSRARIPALFIGAFATATLVAGCAAEQASAPAVTQVVTQTAAPTPLVTPSPTATATASEVSPDGVGALTLGLPFDEAVEAAGATVNEQCDWIASTNADGYTLTIQREPESPESTLPVDYIQVSAQTGSGPIGPRTAEGIGIGSTVDQARAAYPDAADVDMPGVPGREYLEMGRGSGAGGVFFTYSEGGSTIWSVTSTTRETLPYESCA